MSETEAATLQKFGAVSVCATPVFVDDFLWGFVLFEDCRNKRYFSEEYTEIMRSSALLFANAVMRAETEKEIQTALFKLQEANRVKNAFLTRVSHEMLTPLNGIMGLMHLVQAGVNSEETKLYLDEMSAASLNLLGLIRNLLTLSEGESDSFEFVHSVVSFKAMCQNTLKAIRRDLAEKRQTAHSDIDPSIPALLVGDEERLTQVITHLLENAMKFTPEYGEIRLSASVLNDEGDAVMLQIEIADTGIGIPKEAQSGIFKVFSRVDESMTREHEGIGLGLPLAKKIIATMGGKIWVDSEPGRGSKFTFTCRLQKSLLSVS